MEAGDPEGERVSGGPPSPPTEVEAELQKLRAFERGRDVFRERCLTAEAEVARLREALYEYGNHRPVCEIFGTSDPMDDPRCTCGLAPLLAAPRPGGEAP